MTTQCASCGAVVAGGEACPRCGGAQAASVDDAAALSGTMLGGVARDPGAQSPAGKQRARASAPTVPTQGSARPSSKKTVARVGPRAAGGASAAQARDTKAEDPGQSSTMPAASDDAAETKILSDAARRVGTTLGSYSIIRVLGEGGMGTVYLAEHTKLGRKVALKMLHKRYAEAPEVVQRFFAEARAVNKILHENIVQITDFIEADESGDNYFIMEYLRGESLSELLVRERPLTLDRALGICVQICSALAAVHAASIIHRDLKPENIFITTRGGQKDFVKLLDFGIAKLMDLDEGGNIPLHKTAAGVVMGTPEYMSPEQACAKPVDHRTDIYSLGVIMYELCAGSPPFKADSFGEMVVCHTTTVPVSPSKATTALQEIPKPLDDLILACLAKRPEDRPESTQEIGDELRRIAERYACQLEQFDVSAKSPLKSRKVQIGIGAALVVALAAGLSLSSGGNEKAAAPPPQEELQEEFVAVPEEEQTPSPALDQTAPAPVDTAPAEVSITFSSTPPAEVFEVGREEPLGTTPIVVTRERSDETVEYELRAEGYKTMVKKVSLEQDGFFDVGLREDRGARKHKKSSSRKGRSADKTSKPKDKTGKPKDKTGKPKDKPRRQNLGGGDVLDPFK